MEREGSLDHGSPKVVGRRVLGAVEASKETTPDADKTAGAKTRRGAENERRRRVDANILIYPST